MKKHRTTCNTKPTLKPCLFFTAFLFLSLNVTATIGTNNTKIDQEKVIFRIKNAENYINKNGKEKAIIEFRKHALDIFLGDYKGNFFVSPLHPELIGTNQFNYKDPTGILVVQEEIEKAKAGGGWLKGRLRKNPQTGNFECRKIFIHPMPGNYFIGSWYHYTTSTSGTCIF